MLSSTDPVVVVDLSTQPSQDPQPPATTDHPAPAQTSLARHSATPRDQITPIPLPNLTHGPRGLPDLRDSLFWDERMFHVEQFW